MGIETVSDIIRVHGVDRAEHPAVIMGDRRLTWAQLLGRSAQTAQALEATRGFTQAYATFDFEVSGGDVSVTLSGQLNASIPDTTSSTEARASFILQRRLGARLVDKQVGGNAGDTPFTTSAPLSGTYRLTPGSYRVNVFATGEAAAVMRPDAQGDLELRSAAGSSNYTFTLTVAP